MNLLKLIFGTKNQRDVKRLLPIIRKINALEEQYQQLSETELKAKTQEFRDRHAAGETLDELLPEAYAVVKNGCRRLVGTTKDICGHALTWNMIPFDVQLIGGIVLHQGKIAEMQTGEGKTLVATFPLYLNALSGGATHLVTVNDYLALRDAQWMGTLFEYLGLTVGCLQNSMNPSERRAQYACDITYGTNSEFGFDYLRDNGMATDPTQVVQRGHAFAIVDEVDSILIDEARTPLIISGPAQHSASGEYVTQKPRVERIFREQTIICTRLLAEAKTAIEEGNTELAQRRLFQVAHGTPKNKQFQHMIEEPSTRRLHEQVESMMLTDMRKYEARDLKEVLLFTIDEKTREVSLTDKGAKFISPDDPEMYVVPDLPSQLAALDGRADLSDAERVGERRAIQEAFAARSERLHIVDQLLRAYALYNCDEDYVVQENKVMIVDEFTGRILPGRRWSEGLHQAVEAKEGVDIERETQTLATITIQNYFRLYKKLSGMTGTAETEASEFNDIYKLDVVAIPTNRPVRRVDGNDLIYKTQREKYRAIIEEVRAAHDRGQPVLLGTVTVDTSEVLSRMLRMSGIQHSVLNAKNHAQEAEIVSNAGQPGAVTIATNMAGRGTDIKLGSDVVWMTEEQIKDKSLTLDAIPKGGKKTLRHLLEEKPCGLYVIASERHESRRIDRQLRGRCSRQGDPGSSLFYLSLEDNLMRLFGSDRLAGMMTRLGLKEGEAIEHSWLNHTVERAQRKVEEQNFSIRKRTLQYDDVMNKQRTIIYGLRQEILTQEGTAHERILDIFNDLIMSRCEELLTSVKEADPKTLCEWIHHFPIAVSEEECRQWVGKPAEAATELFHRIEEAYIAKCEGEVPEMLPLLERIICLTPIDEEWQKFLAAMDDLRRSVNLRGYGQRDPLVEYKREAFEMFTELMGTIKTGIVRAAFTTTTNVEAYRAMREYEARQTTTVHQELGDLTAQMPQTPVQQESITVTAAGLAAAEPEPNGSLESLMANMGMNAQPPETLQPQMRLTPKVGRNDLCPCGSGKKYKSCCGK
ncbi:MAG: preprotein translocase subunit SecA [Kiritimatiellia bacterium]